MKITFSAAYIHSGVFIKPFYEEKIESFLTYVNHSGFKVATEEGMYRTVNDTSLLVMGFSGNYLLQTE